MWHCHGSEGDSDSERISNLSYPWSLKPLITRKSEASSALHAPSKEGDVMHSQHLKSFTLDELENATGNFCPESLIGGGFGFVYKGCINGGPRIDLAVAVKKLKIEGFQGHKEWQVSLFSIFCYDFLEPDLKFKEAINIFRLIFKKIRQFGDHMVCV